MLALLESDLPSRQRPHLSTISSRLAIFRRNLNAKMSSTTPSRPLSATDDSATQRVAAITQQLTTVTRSTPASLPQPIASAPVKKKNKEWKHLPSYRDLPSHKGWPGCAWDVWGKGYDQLGTVNLLTDAVVARSAQEEIRTGHSIALNWPAHLPVQPFYGRKPFEHKLIAKSDKKADERRQAVVDRYRSRSKTHSSAPETNTDEGAHIPVADEELHFNSQSGTQWDCFRHYGHVNLGVHYQGVPRVEIQESFNDSTRPHNPNFESPSAPALKLGVQNWAQHGICGRAILLDVWGYLSRKDLDRQKRGHHKTGYRFGPYDPCGTHMITVDDLRETAQAQGVRFRQGDILLIRVGFTTRYYNSKPSERQKWATSLPPSFAGLESNHRMAAWLWDNHFAAVASDSPCLESWPPRKGYTSLHEQLLAMFGMPIGEMFDLEALTEHCLKERRWTFHFTSWPMNLYGGAASPANAAAYF